MLHSRQHSHSPQHVRVEVTMFIMTHKPYRWLQLLMQLLLLIHYSHAQGIVVPDDLTVYPAYPCTDTQSYFDTVSMKCVKCDTDERLYMVSGASQCVFCDNTTGTVETFSKGGYVSTSWTPANISAKGACSCATTSNTSLIVVMEDNGRQYGRCITCPNGTVANSRLQACISNNTVISSPDADLTYALRQLNSDGAGITESTATQAIISGVQDGTGTARALTVPRSLPLVTHLGPALRGCMDASNRDDCNSLANLCVLQMYSGAAAACQAYNELLLNQQASSRRSSLGSSSTSSNSANAAAQLAAQQALLAAAANLTSLAGSNSTTNLTSLLSSLTAASTPTTSATNTLTATSPKPDYLGPLPWLFYAPGSSYLTSTDVDVSVSFDDADSPLQFVLSQYALNGTWLGFANWTVQLQVCGAPLREAAAWNRFGVNYYSSCTVSAADLAILKSAGSTGAEPVFFEPYLAVPNGGLYPLPVKITNKVDALVGSGMSASDVGHVRRFFFIDNSLSVSTAPAAAGLGPMAILYPSSLSISITIQPSARNKIYPPLVTIGYAALQTRTSSGASVTGPASFSVSYNNPASLNGVFWYAWRTMLVVFLVLVGAPVLCWRLLLYVRKAANRSMDVELLVYFVLAAADTLSATLCIVLFLVSLYWLIMVKLQTAVLVLMVPNDQLYNFWVTVVLAVVGQSVGLLYVLYKQIRVDVFFIDWEKPRRILAKAGGSEESAPVSCWRQMLVVNEWSELQTLRLTYPAFTLLFVVCMLEGANLQTAAYITPVDEDYTTYTNLQQSLLLRFAIAAVWFFIIGMAQWLIKAVVVHRWVHDPLNSYVDLLFLSNVSLVLLDDRQCGYYLHGRNQMPHTDTTMSEINQALLREEEGLVANRGMVSCYVGAGGTVPAAVLNENQVFRMYVTPELRRQYDNTLLAEVESAAQNQRVSKGAITATWQGPGKAPAKALSGAAELSAAFKMAVDEGERNYATQVLIPSYMQTVFKLPPEASASRTMFVHDFHNGWSSTLLMGQEARMFIWEALLFCSIYMNAGVSATTAGLVTFICSRLLTMLRRHFGENNISQKTLVDKHFLI